REVTGSHFEPVWSNGMFGRWACDDRAQDPTGPEFEIPMQGLGLFACRREAWPGINPRFRGFGGEEGSLHEKFWQPHGRGFGPPPSRVAPRLLWARCPAIPALLGGSGPQLSHRLGRSWLELGGHRRALS